MGNGVIDVSRYVNTKTLELDVEVLSPMFLGGAHGNAELRSSSIKSMIRFWWRALYGLGFHDFREMKNEEDKLFGNTENKSKVSVVASYCNGGMPVLKNLPKGQKFKVSSRGRTFNLSIIEYLSYGLHNGNIFVKSHLEPGTKFKLQIKFIPAERYEEIVNSVKALICYGGLGAKCRNGFGSLSSDDTEIDINKFFNGDKKGFPTVNSESLLFESINTHENWQSALSEIGMAYRNARLSLENRHSFVKRGYVARPVEVQRERIPQNIRTGRHAKSYQLSLRKIDGNYKGQILYMPVLYYERNNQNDYLEVYKSMNNYMEKNLKRVTIN